MSDPMAVRGTSDVLLIYNPADITARYDAVQAPNGYILVENDIDPDLLLGAWSLKKSAWLVMPSAPTLQRMFDDVEVTQPSFKRSLIFFTNLAAIRGAMVEDREEIFGGRVPQLDDITARVENLITQISRTRAMLEYWNNRLHSCVQEHGTGQHLLVPKRLEGQATAVEKPVL